MRVVACVEYHGTHPGWHAHAVCDDSGATPGVLRHAGMKRMKASRRREVVPTAKEDVLAAAVRFFKLAEAFGNYGGSVT